MPYQLAWLIFLLPLFSFIVISFFIRPFIRPESKVAGYIAIAAIGGSLALSIWALITVMAAPHHELPVPDISWMVIEGGVTIRLGLLVDSLTAVMLIVVTVVSLMVQIYSQGYMHGDQGYHRYFGWMSLFTFSMLGLILADSLLFMFVFWEMVGLCSYLLIGFWFHRPSAANAAKKAFIVTRIGDFGFLAGILILYVNTGTFDIAELHGLAVAGVLAGTTLTWAAIGIFTGAMGKSAQFPLHVWLPDAMEGPTPVSALIHAATMVAAGVFLVARMFPLFVHSIEAATTVAVIGGFTAIFAASMGLVMTDIKRVLAYSTISQLGYMMLGLGAVAVAMAEKGFSGLEAAKAGAAIGIFHLFTHAYFKALLFMGSGSVNHSTGTFDMRLMGGLRKYMPWTYWTFVIGSLSLAGIWPFAGFWSKDEVLLSAQNGGSSVLFWFAMITVFMTAFYMFRAIFMTFHGEYRGGATDEHGSHSHPHESPSVMVVPLVFLSILAVAAGWWNVTGGFNEFMGYHGHGETVSFIQGFFGALTHSLPLISLVVALSGIFLAYVIYGAKWLSADSLCRLFGPLHTMASRKYWFDELYENIIVKIVLLKGLFTGFQLFDKNVVDGTVNGVASGVITGGKAIRHAQTGQLQLYGLFMGIGVLVIILCVYFFG
ncbi:NADH-quinone oxidoreductase subunit L [Chloroflexota bacterium]